MMDAAGPERIKTPHAKLGAGTATGVFARAAAAPLKLVANGFTGEPVRLGLDRPLKLQGGARLAPDALALDLLLDGTPDAMGRVIGACRERFLGGPPWFRMPPTALSGGRGMGRTHIARSIARAAGVPFTRLNVSGTAGASILGGGRPGPDIQVPSSVVMWMAASGCANPIILVTGIGATLPGTGDALASMMAGESAPRWIDEGVSAVIDLGEESWLLDTADAGSLPPSFPAAMAVVEPKFAMRNGR